MGPWDKLWMAMRLGEVTKPRGEAIKEALGWHGVFTHNDRWCPHPSRKINPAYTCFEFLWYLGGDPDDLSITERASIWKYLSDRGVLQSNYGVYLFHPMYDRQVERVVKELIADKDSRRASIPILRAEHFSTGSADIPCTFGLTFQIRDDKLHMHVHMRSSDAVFGMGNDVPCFQWTQALIWSLLKDAYPDLELGKHFHTSDSMHVYERHWLLLKNLAYESAYSADVPVKEPPMLREEPAELYTWQKYWRRDPSNIPDNYLWAKWMITTAAGDTK